MHLARISLWSLPAEPEHRGLTAHTAWESMPAEAYCAAALGNTAKQNDAIRFTIPPAWLRHAVPPLHKGGPVAGRPNCAAAPGKSDAERQRRLPCAKGAVGERRLRD